MSNGNGGRITVNNPEAAKKLSDESTKGKKKKTILEPNQQNKNSKDNMGDQSSKNDNEDTNTDLCDSGKEEVDEPTSAKSKDADISLSLSKGNRQTQGMRVSMTEPKQKESRLTTAIHGSPNNSHLSPPQMNKESEQTSSCMPNSMTSSTNKPRPLPSLPSQANSSNDKTDKSLVDKGKLASVYNEKATDESVGRGSNETKMKKNKSQRPPQTPSSITKMKTTEFNRTAPIEAASCGAESETSKNPDGKVTSSASVRVIQNKAATIGPLVKPKTEVSKKNKAKTVYDKGDYTNANATVGSGPYSTHKNERNMEDKTDTNKRAAAEKGPSTEKEYDGDIFPINVQSCRKEISELDVDVIVSSEDGHLQGQGMVATHLEKKGEKVFKEMKLRTLEMCTDQVVPPWQITSSPCEGKLKCKKVFHAHVRSIQYEKDEDEWCRMLKKLFQNLFYRANAMGFTSIAVPLLGTGRNGTPIPFVIDLLGEEILQFLQNTTDKRFLKDIFIVHPDSKTTAEIDSKIQTRAKELGLDDTSFSHNLENQNTTLKNEKAETIKKHSSKESDDICPICMDTIDSSNRKELPLCHHVFCRDCIDKCFTVSKPMCPTCNTVYGVITGNQPPGYMMEMFRKEKLPGFKCGTICILYLFHDGIQQDDHPHKGRKYKGTKRSAYLPDNAEGQKVHRLLRKAFEQRLTFTIGNSRTTGKDNVVTWNDIHHKTRIDGGPAKFGYPDPGYIDRVLDELKAKGLVED